MAAPNKHRLTVDGGGITTRGTHVPRYALILTENDHAHIGRTLGLNAYNGV